MGFIVVAITSDMGFGNRGLWTQLNIAHNKECFFSHPNNDSLKVFVFADIPHLLKLVRNHLLDQGFKLPNGKEVNRECLELLISMSSSELTVAHKINRYHLDIKGSERQKVRPAAQVVSNQISKAIE